MKADDVATPAPPTSVPPSATGTSIITAYMEIDERTYNLAY